jgi:hypothetical protein
MRPQLSGKRFAATMVAVAALAAPLAITTSCTPIPGASGCYLFPDNNVWHADVSKLPVNSHSAAWMASSGGTTSLRIHPDFAIQATL